MNRIAIILATVLLAGCAASDAALQRQMLAGKEPAAVYVTAKGLVETADCIETAMGALVGAGQSMSITTEGDTRIAWVTNLTNPFATVRMTPVEEGTQVDYRARFQSSARPFANAVMGCR